jgi:hypothetical protein
MARAVHASTRQREVSSHYMLEPGHEGPCTRRVTASNFNPAPYDSPIAMRGERCPTQFESAFSLVIAP